jgi:hypothetical protein
MAGSWRRAGPPRPARRRSPGSPDGTTPHAPLPWTDGAGAVPSPTSTTIGGPFDDNWQANDVTEPGVPGWAPSGGIRSFNVTTELRVGGTSNTAGTPSCIAVDSTDGSVSTTCRLAWKKCPDGDGGGA